MLVGRKCGGLKINHCFLLSTQDNYVTIPQKEETTGAGIAALCCGKEKGRRMKRIDNYYLIPETVMENCVAERKYSAPAENQSDKMKGCQ